LRDSDLDSISSCRISAVPKGVATGAPRRQLEVAEQIVGVASTSQDGNPTAVASNETWPPSHRSLDENVPELADGALASRGRESQWYLGVREKFNRGAQ